MMKFSKIVTLSTLKMQTTSQLIIGKYSSVCVKMDVYLMTKYSQSLCSLLQVFARLIVTSAREARVAMLFDRLDNGEFLVCNKCTLQM